MTREEIKAIGKHIADKVFHRKHKEVKIEGTIVSNYRVLLWEIVGNHEEYRNIEFPYDFLMDSGFKINDKVEITIKSKE